MTVRHRVFARMWGVAVLAHIAGNPEPGGVGSRVTALGVLLLVAGALATYVIVAPRRWALLALAAAVPVTAALEAPILGNHWLLAAFVSLVYLAVGGRWERFEPGARAVLLVAYSFAAFAKVNAGFFDPEVSCGVHYLDQLLGGYGLGPVPTGSVGRAVTWAAALTELSIPVLLLVRRTRPWGVVLGLVFHGLISLDLEQHFYDFTSVLAALFVLFLDDTWFESFEGVAERIRPQLRPILLAAVVVVGVAVTAAAVGPLTVAGAWWLGEGSFLWWVPFLALLLRALPGSLHPAPMDRTLGPVPVAVVVLVVANGLTPYLELKTAFGWNMYSNLVTVDGESNHLLIRSTWPLRDAQSDLVDIVATDDPALQDYVDAGYRLPWPSFRSYLAAHPDVAVTYERAGERVVVERAGDTELSDPVPWWWRWAPLRSVAAERPDECQPVYLRAL